MRIYIKTLTGPSFPIEIQADDEYEKLTETVQRCRGVPVEDQRD